MPPLEALADAMVAQLNAAELSADFVARWDYETVFDKDEHNPGDPADVLLLIKSEETSSLNRALLGTELTIEMVVRCCMKDSKKDTILPLRELCESLFYFWAPPQERRVSSVQKVWLRTVVDMPYSVPDLGTNLFTAVGSLTFGITR